MRVIKRDGREVPYNFSKIINAIEAANNEVAVEDQISEMEIGYMQKSHPVPSFIYMKRYYEYTIN